MLRQRVDDVQAGIDAGTVVQPAVERHSADGGLAAGIVVAVDLLIEELPRHDLEVLVHALGQQQGLCPLKLAHQEQVALDQVRLLLHRMPAGLQFLDPLLGLSGQGGRSVRGIDVRLQGLQLVLRFGEGLGDPILLGRVHRQAGDAGLQVVHLLLCGEHLGCWAVGVDGVFGGRNSLACLLAFRLCHIQVFDIGGKFFLQLVDVGLKRFGVGTQLLAVGDDGFQLLRLLDIELAHGVEAILVLDRPAAGGAVIVRRELLGLLGVVLLGQCVSHRILAIPGLLQIGDLSGQRFDVGRNLPGLAVGFFVGLDGRPALLVVFCLQASHTRIFCHPRIALGLRVLALGLAQLRPQFGLLTARLHTRQILVQGVDLGDQAGLMQQIVPQVGQVRPHIALLLVDPGGQFLQLLGDFGLVRRQHLALLGHRALAEDCRQFVQFW